MQGPRLRCPAHRQVTGSNVESVAEDEIMRMLILMRNFLPGYLQASSKRSPITSSCFQDLACQDHVSCMEVLCRRVDEHCQAG